MSAITPVSLALLGACIVFEAGRELCFKHAATSSSSIGAALRQPLVWAGIVLWLTEWILWVGVLARMPLDIAFPLMALVYVVVPLLSRWLLAERINARQMAGAACVALGIACVGYTGI